MREKTLTEEKVQLLGKGPRAAKISTYVTITQTGVKAIVGLLSGSIDLLADAVHSLSDILSCSKGVRIAGDRHDERRPRRVQSE